MIDYKSINKNYRESVSERLRLMGEDDYKICFTCKDILPVSAFSVNNRSYGVPSQKGRAFVCNECKSIRDGKEV